MNDTSMTKEAVKRPASFPLSNATMVKIISIWSKCAEIASRVNNFVYEVQIPAPAPRSELEILEAAFCLTNRDNRPLGNQVCSTSSGDIMVVYGNHYLVEGVGFHKLTLEESEKIQKLTSRDTSLGYNFLKTRKLI